MRENKNSSIKYLTLILLLTWLVSACTLKPYSEGTPKNPQQLNAPKTLITPHAQSPAAGICGGFEGELVTVTINPDIPDPRCVKVRAEQLLVVVNHRGEQIEVQIGNFSTSILPNNSHLFDITFGEYLAPGVHRIDVSPCCGAEIILPAP